MKTSGKDKSRQNDEGGQIEMNIKKRDSWPIWKAVRHMDLQIDTIRETMIDTMKQQERQNEIQI